MFLGLFLATLYLRAPVKGDLRLQPIQSPLGLGLGLELGLGLRLGALLLSSYLVIFSRLWYLFGCRLESLVPVCVSFHWVILQGDLAFPRVGCRKPYSNSSTTCIMSPWSGLPSLDGSKCKKDVGYRRQ